MYWTWSDGAFQAAEDLDEHPVHVLGAVLIRCALLALTCLQPVPRNRNLQADVGRKVWRPLLASAAVRRVYAYDSVVLKVELVFCRLKMIKLKSWINLLVTGCLFREVFLSCMLFLASSLFDFSHQDDLTTLVSFLGLACSPFHT